MADDGRREIWQTLEPSTFRSIPWFVESITVTGGRKATEKAIINSSEQVVMDVGLKQRTYSVRGFITALYKKAPSGMADTLAEIEAETEARAAREKESGVTETGPLKIGKSAGTISADYREMRLLLTTAFELPGSASLVHPIEGEIRNLICKEFSIDEAMTEVGIGRVTATFVRETTTPIPEPIEGAKEEVEADAKKADLAADLAIAENWETTNSFVGAIESAADKVADAYAKALVVAESVETVLEAMDQFQRDIAELTADVFSVVDNAIAVADTIKGVFSSINSLFALPGAAFQAIQNGFDFGDVDLSFDFSTPSGKQKKANFDAINTANQSRYLTQAYRAALDLPYVTVEDVAVVEGILDAQHKKIMDSGVASEELKESLVTLRGSCFTFLGDAKLNARAIVTEEVVTSTPRTLSYLLYDDDSDAATIAGLNDVRAYETISGGVTVLSR